MTSTTRKLESGDPAYGQFIALSSKSSFLWPSLPSSYFTFYLDNYTILSIFKDTKDTRVATAVKGSQEISFAKFWVVLPCGVLFMLPLREAK